MHYIEGGQHLPDWQTKNIRFLTEIYSISGVSMLRNIHLFYIIEIFHIEILLNTLAIFMWTLLTKKNVIQLLPLERPFTAIKDIMVIIKNM